MSILFVDVVSSTKQSFDLCLSIAEELDDRWCKSNVLNSLGELARLQEDYETAHAFYLQGMEIAKQIANHQMLAILDLNLGHVAATLGDVEEAWEYYSVFASSDLDWAEIC